MISNAIASLAVDNISRAAQWYERLFGRPADSAPVAELVEWKFRRGGWLQVYQSPDRAGRGSCTLSVDDLAGEVSRLRKAGFDVGEPAETGTVKVVMIKDPDGNSIAFSESSDATAE